MHLKMEELIYINMTAYCYSMPLSSHTLKQVLYISIKCIHCSCEWLI